MATEDEAKQAFLDSLPEAHGILVDFLNEARQATTITDVNVAAGVAHQRLTQD